MSIVGRFVEVAKLVLSMKCRDFLRFFVDCVPKVQIVGEDETLEDIIDEMLRGASYIVIVDRRGRLRGALSYLDILHHLASESKHMHTPMATAIPGMRSLELSDRSSSIRISLIARPLPPKIREDATVEEALKNMVMTESPYIIVVDKNDNVLGVITQHSIFRAISMKMRS